jgi:hypothetical protein
VDTGKTATAANRGRNGDGSMVWMPVHGLGAVVRTVGLTDGPTQIIIFPKFPKPVQTCKIELDALH